MPFRGLGEVNSLLLDAVDRQIELQRRRIADNLAMRANPMTVLPARELLSTPFESVPVVDKLCSCKYCERTGE